MREEMFCTIEGCSQPLLAHGYCPMHYKRWKVHGDPGTAERLIRSRYIPPDPCRVEGCERVSVYRDKLCNMHGVRLHQRGNLGPAYALHRPKGTGGIENGYLSVVVHGHPNARPDGRIRQHRLVMSEMLGRPLLHGEEVHHKNRNKLDNDPKNLELWSCSQPPSARVEDLVHWARQILSEYGALFPE